MIKPQQAPSPWQAPEKMPQTQQALDRAIMLLGSMVKSELRCRARQELIALLGCLPSPQVAPVWKLALKRHRKALLEMSEGDFLQPPQQGEASQ